MKNEKMAKVLARILFWGFSSIALFSGIFTLLLTVAVVEAWEITKAQIAMYIVFISAMTLYGAFLKMLNEKW